MTEKQRLDRVGELTSALLDSRLDEAGREELNELLRGDPEACERYLDLSEHDAALVHDAVAAKWTPPEETGSVPVSSSRVVRPGARTWPIWLAAAIVVVLLVLNFALFGLFRPESNPEPLAEGNWVAVIGRVVDADWDDESGSLNEGDPLSTAEYRLESGLAQLEFFSGASVIVEGPAEFRLVSPRVIDFQRGTLRAFVPEPARGFTVKTPPYRVIDVGTEFAIRVDDRGNAELHVVEGEVRLEDQEGKELARVVAGEALRSEDGMFLGVTRSESDFVDRGDLLGLAEAASRSRYEIWAENRKRLDSDPALLVDFDFENQSKWDRLLVNRATGGSDGAVIGASRIEGRWPGKGAIEFRRITDRIRLRVEGQHEALSLATWVRLEGFDRWLSSLMLTDGFDLGEVHWQVSDEGELILGIATEESGSPNTMTESVIGPRDLGRWLHLAVTVDRTSGEVIHYLDGQPVVRDQRNNLPPLRIGAAEIGNWTTEGMKNHPIRSLNGTMDEFLVLSRVLGPEEIRVLYETGQP